MKVFMGSNPKKIRQHMAENSGIKVLIECPADGACASIDWDHHGNRQGELCPCLHENSGLPDIGDMIVYVSHLDLDTLGGFLAAISRKPNYDRFWNVAAYVDENGPHRIDDVNPSEIVKNEIHAFWAWSEENRLYAERDGSVKDVTKFFLRAEEALRKILNYDGSMINAGKIWLKEFNLRNAKSFRRMVKTKTGIKIAIRESVDGHFVNGLYKTPDGVLCDIVLSLNRKTGTITLSCDNKAINLNCCEFLQEIFGPEAGGHAGIAGSPRGMECGENDRAHVETSLIRKLK
jgi:hypothetical protein